MIRTNSPVVVWFRQDLRLKDNPALLAAHRTGCPIVPVFILDDETSGKWKLGQASRWWLHESLMVLNEMLEGKLCLQVGSAQKVLSRLIRELGAGSVFWNRCYEPWRIHRDTSIQETLMARGIGSAQL